MGDTSLLSIGVQVLGRHVPKEGTVEEKLREAMRHVDEIWFTIEDDLLFRCAVGAVLVEVGADSEDGKRITDELKFLRYMAAGAGESMGAWIQSHDPESVIGLMKIWKEVRAE